MISDREEALPAHELARTRIANRKQSKFIPFEKNQKVWLDMREKKSMKLKRSSNIGEEEEATNIM
jgi:hypothetical protein